MEFPDVDFVDEEACFEALFKLVHSERLRCPRCGQKEGLVVQDHHGPSWILDYQCPLCHRVFNAWTETPFEKTHHPPSEILWIVKGMVEGKSTAQLARELHCHRGRLLTLRHRWQPLVTSRFGPPPHKKYRIRETAGREIDRPASPRTPLL